MKTITKYMSWTKKQIVEKIKTFPKYQQPRWLNKGTKEELHGFLIARENIYGGDEE